MKRSDSLGESSGVALDPLELVETLRWIHADRSPAESLEALQQVSQDVAIANPPQVLSLRDAGGFAAAAYFRILPGSVATMGGVRARPGHELAAANLLQRLSSQLDACHIQQIQAVVDANEEPSLKLLYLADFGRITCVEQLWLDLEHCGQSATAAPTGATWELAAKTPIDQLIELIDATFIDTLDCPLLNHTRKSENVLLSFLEGKELSQELPWFVLRDQERLVGCVFLSRHSAELFELAYMGLHPSARGLGLGKTLTTMAIQIAREQGSRMLLVGVDEANWRALQIYQQLQFQRYRTMVVLFRNADLRKMSEAARAKQCSSAGETAVVIDCEPRETPDCTARD